MSSQLIDILRHFTPFSQLNDELLRLLSQTIKVCNINPGALLFNINDDDINEYFLVEGQVILTNSDQQSISIEAGLPNSNRALSSSRPRKHSAIAKTAIRYFCINKAVLIELTKNQQRATDYLSILAQGKPIDTDGKALYDQFEHELNRGHVRLPSFPEAALKIRELIDDPDSSIDTIVNLAHSDPSIVAKLIKTANSPLYRGVSPCDNLTSSIMRLGLSTTKQLVTSFAVLNLFVSDSRLLKNELELLRKKSISVAAYAFVLSQHLPEFNPEEALLAGMLHQLGKIVVINYAERFHELDNAPLKLAVLNHQWRSEVGTLAVEQWNFSNQLSMVIKESSDYLRNTSSELDGCDLIIAAKLLVLIDDNIDQVLKNTSCTPALNKLINRLQGPEKLASIINTNRDKIQALKNLFLSH